MLGIVPIGMAAGRGLAAGTLLADRRLMWWVLLAGLAIGVPPPSSMQAPELGQHPWPSTVGKMPLALAYAAAFAVA